MREMVLNHASLPAPDQYTAIDWLSGIASGMAGLVENKVVKNVLRTSQSQYEIPCFQDVSLFEAFQLLRRLGAIEASRFLLNRLDYATPLTVDVDDDIEHRFRMCQEMTLPPEDGKPLMLCAIANYVAISFPSSSTWDRDSLKVKFEELLDNGEFEEVLADIDNLARATHATSIYDRHIINTRDQITNYNQLWTESGQAFPNLIFGPDVKDQIKDLNVKNLANIVKVLSVLDRDAEAWRVSGGSMPAWSGNVSGESQRVMQNPRLREARRFRSHLGTQEIFEWHAKPGDGLRIHLGFDAGSREVEIGYIGQHLPLP